MRRKNIYLAHHCLRVRFGARVNQKVNQRVKAKIKKDRRRKILTSSTKSTWQIDKNKTEARPIK